MGSIALFASHTTLSAGAPNMALLIMVLIIAAIAAVMGGLNFASGTTTAPPPKVTAPAKFRSTRSPSLIFGTIRFDNHVARVTDQSVVDAMLAHQDYGIEYVLDPSTEQELAAIQVPDEPEAPTDTGAGQGADAAAPTPDSQPTTPVDPPAAATAPAAEERADSDPHDKPKRKGSGR